MATASETPQEHKQTGKRRRASMDDESKAHARKSDPMYWEVLFKCTCKRGDINARSSILFCSQGKLTVESLLRDRALLTCGLKELVSNYELENKDDDLLELGADELKSAIELFMDADYPSLCEVSLSARGPFDTLKESRLYPSGFVIPSTIDCISNVVVSISIKLGGDIEHVTVDYE